MKELTGQQMELASERQIKLLKIVEKKDSLTEMLESGWSEIVPTKIGTKVVHWNKFSDISFKSEWIVWWNEDEIEMNKTVGLFKQRWSNWYSKQDEEIFHSTCWIELN